MRRLRIPWFSWSPIFLMMLLVTMSPATAQEGVQGSRLKNESRADERPTVAVLYFDYAGQDEKLKALRKGLAQMLIADLANLENVRIVERDRLETLLNEMKLNRSDKFDRQTVSRIGKLLGARYLVLGNYVDFLGRLRINADLVDVETGRHIAGTSANGKPDEFWALEEKLVEGLTRAATTRLEGFTSGQESGAPASPSRARVRPPAQVSLRTAVQYGAALDAMDRGDRATAKAALHAVVKELPDFALATGDLDRLMQ